MEDKVDYALLAAGVCSLLTIGIIVGFVYMFRYLRRNSKVLTKALDQHEGPRPVQHVVRLETPVTESYLAERPNRPNEICKALLHQIGGNSRVVGVIVEHDPI